MHNPTLQQCAAAAEALLQATFPPHSQPSRARTEVPHTPVLYLARPAQLESFETTMRQQHCSPETAAVLRGAFEKACSRLAGAICEQFSETVVAIHSTFSVGEEEVERAWIEGVEEAMRRAYEDSVDRCHNRLLDGIRLARQRHSSHPAPSAAPSEPGLFTPSILTILNSAFAVCDSVSRAERRELARATGLNERQVLTWFANQRQRRGKKDKTQPSARPPPSSHSRHPSSLSHAHHHSHLPPVRTVSSSSTASSTSLVSYAAPSEQVSDDDIAVDAPYTLPPPPSATAAFASFASQFQVAPLPLPPPPTFFNPHPPAEGESEVPMMEYTSPMPITASFSALGVGVAPSSSSLPGAIDFSQPLFLPPVSHTPSPPSQALSASPTAEVEDGASMVDWTDAESFFSSSSCGAVPVAPAPTPTAGETSGLDGWMDATFYENLLSSLGLTSSSTSSSSGGDSSAFFGATNGALPFEMFDGLEGGGLTLSMEAVRAEVGGGAGGWGGSALDALRGSVCG